MTLPFLSLLFAPLISTSSFATPSFPRRVRCQDLALTIFVTNYFRPTRRRSMTNPSRTTKNKKQKRCHWKIYSFVIKTSSNGTKTLSRNKSRLRCPCVREIWCMFLMLEYKVHSWDEGMYGLLSVVHTGGVGPRKMRLIL